MTRGLSRPPLRPLAAATWMARSALHRASLALQTTMTSRTFAASTTIIRHTCTCKSPCQGSLSSSSSSSSITTRNLGHLRVGTHWVISRRWLLPNAALQRTKAARRPLQERAITASTLHPALLGSVGLMGLLLAVSSMAMTPSTLAACHARPRAATIHSKPVASPRHTRMLRCRLSPRTTTPTPSNNQLQQQQQHHGSRKGSHNNSSVSMTSLQIRRCRHGSARAP